MSSLDVFCRVRVISPSTSGAGLGPSSDRIGSPVTKSVTDACATRRRQDAFDFGHVRLAALRPCYAPSAPLYHESPVMTRTPLSSRPRDLVYFLFFAVSPLLLLRCPPELIARIPPSRSIFQQPFSSTSKPYTRRHGYRRLSLAFQDSTLRCQTTL